jgi:hypothetical protein
VRLLMAGGNCLSDGARLCRRKAGHIVGRGRTSASFTPEGDYLTEWTGMGGPNDISRGKDGNFYVAEQGDDGKPAHAWDTARRPSVLGAKFQFRMPERASTLCKDCVRKL